MTTNAESGIPTAPTPENLALTPLLTIVSDRQGVDIKKIQELLALQLRVADFAIRSEPPKPVILLSSPSEEFASSRLPDRLD